MIKAILACDDQGGVSRNGTLPWPKNTRDLTWFKENTQGHIVVMGRTTWEDLSMPRPLPNRYNVLASNSSTYFPGIDRKIRGNITEQIEQIAQEAPGLITWVIGGPNVVDQCLGIIDEFYISRIPGDYDCDTFLPLKRIETQFNKTWDEIHPEVIFEIWKNKNAS